MLIIGAALMVLGGVVFAFSGDFLVLLLAATIGVISPSGNEVGPFLAIEQAALAETISGHTRTKVFAWYQLAGSLATALGALACGIIVDGLRARGAGTLTSYRVIFCGYAAAGILLILGFIRLSAGAEAGHKQTVTTVFGLHRSRSIVVRLAALFTLDAFAGGFILQSVIAYWFHVRFGANPATLGAILFGANLLAGVSALGAAALARRIGLINTMVFTHVPSNVLLLILPFMPSLGLAILVLFLRFAISQMDVPARQSYTAAVVDPDERSAAAGITGVARTIGAALSPSLAGVFLAAPGLKAAPFIAAGTLKLVYDGLLYRNFRHTKPPEEQKA
jgi:predicted MFS family arabinose efflux permease